MEPPQTRRRFLSTLPLAGATALFGVCPAALADEPAETRTILEIDAGSPITILGGVHVGCYKLFARESIRSVPELKGKSVGLETASPALLKLMAANVGLDPENDFQWVTDRKLKPLELFATGKIDAFLGFPPEPQELHARRVGRVIL